jgi:membrane protease YdiL (CAAX protease family)
MSFLAPLPDDRRIRPPLFSSYLLVMLWTAAELAVAFYLARRGLWVPGTARAMGWIGAEWVTATTLLDLWLRLYTPKQLGLNWENSRKTEDVVYLAILTASFILITGMLFGTARGPTLEAFFLKKAGELLGASAQQIVVELYIFVRLERLTGRKAPWLTAALFSLAHSPNPALMAITLAGGCASSLIFRKYRNLYSLAAAHGIIGAALPTFWRLNMRVGINYLLHLKKGS